MLEGAEVQEVIKFNSFIIYFKGLAVKLTVELMIFPLYDFTLGQMSGRSTEIRLLGLVFTIC